MPPRGGCRQDSERWPLAIRGPSAWRPSSAGTKGGKGDGDPSCASHRANGAQSEQEVRNESRPPSPSGPPCFPGGSAVGGAEARLGQALRKALSKMHPVRTSRGARGRCAWSWRPAQRVCMPVRLWFEANLPALIAVRTLSAARLWFVESRPALVAVFTLSAALAYVVRHRQPSGLDRAACLERGDHRASMVGDAVRVTGLRQALCLAEGDGRSAPLSAARFRTDARARIGRSLRQLDLRGRGRPNSDRRETSVRREMPRASAALL